MKKKLLSINIYRCKNKTTVSWWRQDKNKVGRCFERTIQIRTESTYDRLFRLLPPENASCSFVHPRPDDLSISWLLKEK
jgi:hypothetical protein